MKSFTVDHGTKAIGSSRQLPCDVINYSIDYFPWLAPGETILSVVYNVFPVTVPPLAVTSSAITAGNLLSFTLSGGVTHNDYQVWPEITTSAGQVQSNKLAVKVHGSVPDTMAFPELENPTEDTISQLTAAATYLSTQAAEMVATLAAVRVNPDWFATSGIAKILNKPTTWPYGSITGLPAFAAVATSGSYTDLSNKPTYSTLDGRPTLATVATSGLYSDLTSKPALATVATSGLYADLTSKPALAAVATSGSYADLTSKPAIQAPLGFTPVQQGNSDVLSFFWASNINAITANVNGTNQGGLWTDSYVTSQKIKDYLGYVPYNSTNPAGYITGFNGQNVHDALGYWPFSNVGGDLWGDLYVHNVIRADQGYECKLGSDGGFTGDVFNLAWTGAGVAMYIDGSYVGVVSLVSDPRLKADMQPMPDALSTVMAIEPITYRWAGVSVWKDDGKTNFGFNAEQVRSVFPAGVVGEPNAVEEDGGIKPLSMNPVAIIGLLTKAIQEIAARVKKLEA